MDLHDQLNQISLLQTNTFFPMQNIAAPTNSMPQINNLVDVVANSENEQNFMVKNI